MSRSNPSDAASNPATRWFEFASGSDGGYVRYYDKNAKQNVNLGDAEIGSSGRVVSELVGSWSEVQQERA